MKALGKLGVFSLGKKKQATSGSTAPFGAAPFQSCFKIQFWKAYYEALGLLGRSFEIFARKNAYWYICTYYVFHFEYLPISKESQEKFPASIKELIWNWKNLVDLNLGVIQG